MTLDAAPHENVMDLDFDVAGVCEGQDEPMDLGSDPGCESSAMHLDVDSPSNTSAECTWRPGFNVTGWLGRSRRGRSGRVELQSQVLIVNGYLAIDRLPSGKKRLLRE
eukprot:4745444-Karenia_brevis.AAC.1